MLTRKQRDLLLFINDFINDNGVSPSFDEMKEALDLKSKSGIHRLINALVERGFLERLPHKARALEVKRLPDDAGHKPAQQPGSNVASMNFREGSPETVQIPVHGKIAAGTPIEALRHEQETIDVPMGFLGSSECYALTIEGNSMEKAGIMDGDIVIIEKCDQARDGDIVVALVDEEEVTLKRLRREVGKIILQPENDGYTPIELHPEQVRIQGKLRSLFRYY